MPAGKQYLQLEQPHDNMITPYNMEDKPSKLESGESSNSGSFEDLNFLLDEPFLDAFANLEEFIETNDILNPVQTNASASDMLDEYLSFVDANDNSPYLTYDSAVIAGSNGFTSDQVLLSQKVLLTPSHAFYCSTLQVNCYAIRNLLWRLLILAF